MRLSMQCAPEQQQQLELLLLRRNSVKLEILEVFVYAGTGWVYFCKAKQDVSKEALLTEARVTRERNCGSVESSLRGSLVEEAKVKREILRDCLVSD